MKFRRPMVLATLIVPLVVLAPMSDSHSDNQVEQLVGRIHQNFIVIDREIAKRGSYLSAVFLAHIDGNRAFFEELKTEKPKYENVTSGSADLESYVADLKALHADTSGAASFLQTAPSDDDGVTNVRFLTEFRYKANDGWRVCWISYGQSRKKRDPHCFYDQYSTPVPKPDKPPTPLASGCKYIVTIVDPQIPGKPYNQFYDQNGQPTFVEIPPQESIYELRVPVPYKIKK